MAHISRLKALEASRRVPRQFGLYLPPTLDMPPGLDVVMEGAGGGRSMRIISTTSLSFTINRLDAIMKASRSRKSRGRGKEPPRAEVPVTHPSPPSRPRSNSGSEFRKSRAAFPAFAASKKRKGKRRAVTAVKSLPTRPVVHSKPPQKLMPKAWFLDVASPTWADLRAIGMLLHIHPLTLEDILQQDPREKLELFPKLGYYFISFRAIESKAERSRMQREARKHAEMSGGDPDAADIPMGEANVYLVVFNDGICCFHFRDISDHLERVRNRIVLLDEVVNMSSDWIAHGILDSIVDSFFPFFNEIEREVMDIDDLVYADADAEEISEEPVVIVAEPHTPSTLKQELPPEPTPLTKESPLQSEEKKTSAPSNPSEESIRPHFTAPRPTLRMLFRRARRYIIGLWHRLSRLTRAQNRPAKVNPRITTLRRMAKTRRLVTNLGRSLAGKSEVVTRIRKRLLQQGFEPALGNGGSKSEELEVAIYMGDIHDHILTLQGSLNHMERMLSQSHPSYLSQLRMNLARTKGGSDKALLYLTVISIAVLCSQAITGTFSMNVTAPANRAEPGAPLNVFGVAVSLVCLVMGGYLSLVYHWWKTAKRRTILRKV